MPLLSLPRNSGVHKSQALRRHAALEAAGCSTYTLGTRDRTAVIVCLCCGRGSTHPRDVRERYCGFCHLYHVEWRAGEPGTR